MYVVSLSLLLYCALLLFCSEQQLCKSCKNRSIMAVFFIAVLYCQYILQLNWLFTVERLDCFVPEKIF